MLKPVNVLITAAGCPGASTLIQKLQLVKERKITVIGVDSNIESIGRFMADSFELVPNADNESYLETLLSICETYAVDCLLVSSSYEVERIAAGLQEFAILGVKVLASSPESLELANNKLKLYQQFRSNPDVTVPEFTAVRSLDEFVSACKEMGYPDRKLCFKPPVSKGSRGFRYLSSDINRADLLMNQKPNSSVISLEEVIEIFKNETFFPELILMETVEGEEIDSMVIADEGELLLVTHKTREAERGGVITVGGHVERDSLSRQISSILKKVKLSYNIGIQFKGGYLMEINPRLSTFLYKDEWNEPYFAIKYALGELSKAGLRALASEIPANLRMIRYFDQYFYENDA